MIPLCSSSICGICSWPTHHPSWVVVLLTNLLPFHKVIFFKKRAYMGIVAGVVMLKDNPFLTYASPNPSLMV